VNEVHGPIEHVGLQCSPIEHAGLFQSDWAWKGWGVLKISPLYIQYHSKHYIIHHAICAKRNMVRGFISYSDKKLTINPDKLRHIFHCSMLRPRNIRTENSQKIICLSFSSQTPKPSFYMFCLTTLKELVEREKFADSFLRLICRMNILIIRAPNGDLRYFVNEVERGFLSVYLAASNLIWDGLSTWLRLSKVYDIPNSSKFWFIKPFITPNYLYILKKPSTMAF